MNHTLDGSDLPAPLAECWRGIARHVAKTGKFPSGLGLALACGCSISHATDMRRRLVLRGYLARDNGAATATRWTLLAWPAGITPRETVGDVEPCRRLPGEPTMEQIKRMNRMRKDGYSIAAIARVTGYSCYRVEIVVGSRMKVSKPEADCQAKRRACLMCHSPFRSEGPHHRVCTECKGTSRWRSGGDLSFAVPARGQ